MTFNRLPTSTAHQSRLRLFQATRRPKPIEETIETAWGKVRVKGRLGQQHADILEAFLHACDKNAKIDDGRIKLLVDPYKIMKTSSQKSWSTFKNNLDDLMQAIIEIKEPEKLRCIGHLIDHIDKAVKSDGTVIKRQNPFGGERELWRVEIGKAGTLLIEQDIKLYYDPDKVAQLQHGISQAVARHILTHQAAPEGGWQLDRMIATVAPDDARDSVAVRHRRRELREDRDALSRLGISLVHDRLYLEGASSKDQACSKSVMACSKSAMACTKSAERAAKAWGLQ